VTLQVVQLIEVANLGEDNIASSVWPSAE